MRKLYLYALLAIVVLLLVTGKRDGNMKVYGSMDCPWTRKQLEYNNQKGLSYVFVDCKKNTCPNFVKGFPTTKTGDGKIYGGYSKI